MVRAFAYGVMGRRINPPWDKGYFSFQPELHDLCNKAVVGIILSVGWCI